MTGLTAKFLSLIHNVELLSILQSLNLFCTWLACGTFKSRVNQRGLLLYYRKKKWILFY